MSAQASAHDSGSSRQLRQRSTAAPGSGEPCALKRSATRPAQTTDATRDGENCHPNTTTGQLQQWRRCMLSYESYGSLKQVFFNGRFPLRKLRTLRKLKVESFKSFMLIYDTSERIRGVKLSLSMPKQRGRRSRPFVFSFSA